MRWSSVASFNKMPYSGSIYFTPPAYPPLHGCRSDAPSGGEAPRSEAIASATAMGASSIARSRKRLRRIRSPRERSRASWGEIGTVCLRRLNCWWNVSRGPSSSRGAGAAGACVAADMKRGCGMPRIGRGDSAAGPAPPGAQRPRAISRRVWAPLCAGLGPILLGALVGSAGGSWRQAVSPAGDVRLAAAVGNGTAVFVAGLTTTSISGSGHSGGRDALLLRVQSNSVDAAVLGSTEDDAFAAVTLAPDGAIVAVG